MQDDDETDEHDVERADEDMVDAGADLDVVTLIKEQMMTMIAMVKGQTRTLLSLQVWP